MAWTEAVPAALTATALLFLPGALVGLAAGWRGLAVLGASPLLSVGLIGVSALIAPLLGWDWSVLPLLVLSVAAALGAWLVRVVARRAGLAEPARDGRAVLLGGLLGLAVGAVLGVVPFLDGLGRADAISQTYDASFHYNAVQYAVDEGNASSMFLGTMVSPGLEQRFYPAAWHALTALVATHVEADTILAVSGVSAVIIGLVWPVSSMLLVRQLLGPRWALVAAAGALSSAFLALPVRMMARGVLWPNSLGYVLVPAALAALVGLVGLAAKDVLGRAQALAMLMVAVPALGLSHPNTLFALAVLGAPAVLTASVVFSHRAWTSGRRRLAATPWLGVGAAALAVVVVARSSDLLAVVTRFDWPARATVPEAVADVALLATNNGPPALVLSVLVGIGLVASLRTWRLAWLSPTFVAVGLLYVMAIGVDSPLSQVLTGAWYNDSFRVAAMLPVIGVPLAAVGLGTVAALVVRTTARWASPDARTRAWAHEELAVAGTAAVVLLGTGLAYASARADVYRVFYALESEHGTSRLLTRDEYDVMRQIPDVVAPEVAVAGNPWNGSAITYAVTGRPVLFPHLDGSWDEPRQIVAGRLRDIAVDEEVCAAAQDLNLGFVLLSGPALWPDHRSTLYPGLEALDDAPGFEVVARQGDTTLYRITDCAGEPYALAVSSPAQ